MLTKKSVYIKTKKDYSIENK